MVVASTVQKVRLRGRDDDLAAATALLDAAAEGHGGALVLTGPPGIGRTALLDAIAAAQLGGGDASLNGPAPGGAPAPATVLTVAGCHAESALPFAALHRLFAAVPYPAAAHRADAHRAGIDRAGAFGPDAHRTGMHLVDTFPPDVHRTGIHLIDVFPAGMHGTGIHRAGAFPADTHGTGASSADAPRAGAFRAGAPRADGPQGDASPADAPRAGAFRAGAPGADGPRGERHDRLAAGLAVLATLRELAGSGPVAVLLDDAHALDRATLDALAVAARRAGGERIAILFALRDTPGCAAAEATLAGLPRRRLGPLDLRDSRYALADTVPGLAGDVAGVLASRAGGNPRALAELAAALTAEQRRGEATPPSTPPRDSGLRREYRTLLRTLPPDTRRVLVLAAAAARETADGTTCPAPLLLAAGHRPADLTPAERVELVQVEDGLVRFIPPLFAAVVYAEAGLAERHAAHRRLAALVGDRRTAALHRAAIATGPDDALAAELAATALTPGDTLTTLTPELDPRPAAPDTWLTPAGLYAEPEPVASSTDSTPVASSTDSTPAASSTDSTPAGSRAESRPVGHRAALPSVAPDIDSAPRRSGAEPLPYVRGAAVRAAAPRTGPATSGPRTEPAPGTATPAATPDTGPATPRPQTEPVPGAPDGAAGVAALERAAALTTDPAKAAAWTLGAARLAWRGGEPYRARLLLRTVFSQAVPPALHAERELLLGEVELRTGAHGDAQHTLLGAAARLPGRRALRALCLAGEALGASGRHDRYAEVADRALALRAGTPPTQTEELLFEHFAGMAAGYAGDPARAAGSLRRVVALAAGSADPPALVRAAWAGIVAGRDDDAYRLAVRAGRLARGVGDRATEPLALEAAATAALALGDLDLAAATAAEGLRLAGATGQDAVADNCCGLLAVIAGIRGDAGGGRRWIRRCRARAGGDTDSQARAMCVWAASLLDVAEGRHADAAGRLWGVMRTAVGRGHLGVQVPAIPTLVEAVARSGDPGPARQVLAAYDLWANSTANPTWLALSARCHGLLAAGDDEADAHFREALRLHLAGDSAFPGARTELLYGEELRRRRRPAAAREHLRSALATFEQYDAGPWVRRAAAELRAAGDHVEPAGGEHALTAQQARIARLVADGATNREIAAALFVSPRTVDHHLRNIFVRLGVRSRTELARVLP